MRNRNDFTSFFFFYIRNYQVQLDANHRHIVHSDKIAEYKNMIYMKRKKYVDKILIIDIQDISSIKLQKHNLMEMKRKILSNYIIIIILVVNK